MLIRRQGESEWVRGKSLLILLLLSLLPPNYRLERQEKADKTICV